MRHNLIRLAAAVFGTAALIAAGAGVASAAPSCTVDCTSGSVQVGSTLGTTGFPTSFAITGNAGSTASAVATPYSVYSNQAWTLSFETDPSDNVAQNGVNPPLAMWQINAGSNSPVTFPIGGTTTIAHAGSLGNTPFSLSGSGVESVQIDSGAPTAGGQGFTDTFAVAIPATAAPGNYLAEFAYVLVG
jgi:hypothetical protein